MSQLFFLDQENSEFSLQFTKNLFKTLFSKDTFPQPLQDNQQSTEEDLSPIYSRPFILNKSLSDIIPQSHINPPVFSNSLPTMSVFLIEEQERTKNNDKGIDESNERFTIIMESIKTNQIDLVLENEAFIVPEAISVERNYEKQSEIIKNPFFSIFFREIVDEIVEKVENSETSPEKIVEEDLTSPETISSPFKISDISSKKYSCEESLDDFQSQKATFYRKLETITVNPCNEDIDEKETCEKNEENCTLEELTNEETVNKPREFITTDIKKITENNVIMVETNKENNKMPELVKNGSSSASTQENSFGSGIFTKGSSFLEENKESVIKEGILLKKSRNFLSGWQVKIEFLQFLLKN